MDMSFISTRFEKWRPVMAKILEKNGWYQTVDDTYLQCSECRQLFFDVPGAFAVVNVIEHPKDTRLHVALAGGTLKGLDQLDTVIGDFGRAIGASKASFVGRRGLARVMAKRGWKSPFVYMEKEIV